MEPDRALEVELSFLAKLVRHDLREPLRAVQGFTRGVAERYTDVLDERARDRLERVVKAAVRLDTLVSELSVYLEARCLDPRCETVKGRELVDAALAELQGLCAQRSARVEVDSALPELCVDREWAARALSKLLANAIVFGAAEAPRVEVAGLAGEPGFAVRDGGEGFAAEPETLFPLFRRGVHRSVPGHGAGLAIARAVARRHGGDVEVRASAATGSEVVIRFAGREQA